MTMIIASPLGVRIHFDKETDYSPQSFIVVQEKDGKEIQTVLNQKTSPALS